MLSFPVDTFPISGGFAPYAKSLSGGQSISGFEQVTSQLNDRWTAAYAFSIRTDADVLKLRAFVLAMRGRANTVDLPAFDLARAPWARDAYGRTVTPGFSRSKTLDGTIYEDSSGLRAGLIDATLAAPAALNATTISVNINAGGTPLPGHLFSIATRLYSALSITGSGSPYGIEIWPSARTALEAGWKVNFATPSCEMRFATDMEGADALSSLSGLRFATATLKFDEVPV